MPNWKKVIVSGSDAVLNSVKVSTNITASNISASGNLFANISDNSSTSFKTVVVDPTTGQLYRTGSYGSGGGGGTGNGFPFEGDALITGSLTISQSYTAGDTDSTALRLIGSGSVSQSGIFEVEGSAGPLFSVQDGLDGILMEVNNISGLPLFQVSSSNEIFINRGNLTSGTTTATASFANFSGSFQGDGTNLNLANNTTIPTSNPFPFTGDAQITGSLLLSGSLQLDYSGNGNMIIGSGSGEVLQSGGINNLIFGNNAATSLTTGDQNVIIGNRAGDSSNLNIESNNVYIGYEAGKDAVHQASYGDNVFIGTQAGKDSKAQFSQFIGSNAGQGLTAFSVGVGANALSCTAEHSVAIGYSSQNNGTNHYNVSVGSKALNAHNPAANNEKTVAIGYFAAQNSYNVDDGIYIGYYAGQNTNTSRGNIIIGSGSLCGPVNYQLRIGHADIHPISASLETGDVIFYNTASAPNFSGSFQGDGSNLTGITATAGSTAGRVVFTTTNGELTTESGFEYNSTTDQLKVHSLDVVHLTSSFITSSRIHTSGSNIFGDDTTDTQTLIGTTKITGSAEVTGSLEILSAASKPPVKIYNSGTNTLVSFGDGSTRFQIPASGMATMVGFKMYSGILDGNLDGNSKVINKLDRLELGGYGFGGTSVVGMVGPAGTVTTATNGFAMYPDDANGAGTVSPHFKTEDGSILTLATTSSLKRVISDSSKISGSGGLIVESSGSTVFEVIGSQGTQTFQNAAHYFQ